VAVHEQRKALRRARATVNLVRPVLGRRGAESFIGPLREALRCTSGIRDAHVLENALRDAFPDEPALRKRIVAGCGSRRHSRDEGASLRRAGANLEGLAEQFGRALRGKIRWRDVRKALKRSFGRARDARAEVVVRAQAEAVHAWRKRVKELRYQLELLRSLGAVKGRRRFAVLAERLGAITDLMVLRELVASLPIVDGEVAVARLDREISVRVARETVQSRALFSPSPRRYVRAIFPCR